MLLQISVKTFYAGMLAQELLINANMPDLYYFFFFFLKEQKKRKKKKKSAQFTGPEQWPYWLLPNSLQGGNASSVTGTHGGELPGLVCGGSPGQLNNIGFPSSSPTSKGLGLCSSPCITALPCWRVHDTTLDRSHPWTAWEILKSNNQKYEGHG